MLSEEYLAHTLAYGRFDTQKLLWRTPDHNDAIEENVLSKSYDKTADIWMVCSSPSAISQWADIYCLSVGSACHTPVAVARFQLRQ